MTRLRVCAAGPRVRIDADGGPLAVRTLRRDATSARVAFVATQALLLAGDHVTVEVEVGPGVTLAIEEIAGTVAYDAAGVAASWTINATVGTGGRLVWSAEPFVVAVGAAVTRSTTIALADGATALLRETLVLGRTGETGGALHNHTRLTLDEKPLLIEDLDLTEAGRTRPGILGSARVVDSALLLGDRAPAEPVLPPGTRFDLAGPGTVARVLRADLAGSPVAAWFRCWSAHLLGDGAAG